MNLDEITRRMETKAFAYGVSSTVATLLGEYVRDLLKEIPTDRERKPRVVACPLCSDPLEFAPSGETRVWKCPACPFVGLEFYGDDDLVSLENSLRDFGSGF